MDLIKLIKHKFSGKAKSPDNQIDPEHFFEKIGFQNLYSDLMETVEIDINDLNNIENPITVNNSIISTNSSFVNSVMSSFNGKINEEVPKNSDSNMEFVRSLLNEDEKKPEQKKRKVLKLKNYMENFYNRSCEKDNGKD